MINKVKLKSCNVQDKSLLVKRARAKYLSINLAFQLKKENPTSELSKSYTNTLYCSSIIIQQGKTLKTKYCKNRWCAVCNRIRTGKAIRSYLNEIRLMKDPYFVTLTKVTVLEKDLSSSIKKMNDVFRAILLSRDNKYNRKIKGLRKSECTTRPFGMYHYHYHLIIDGKDNANWVIAEWLRLMGELAKSEGQDLRQADERSQKEMFKYFSKLTIQNKGKDRELMNFKRMDVIFRAMRGKRVYQGFGGIKVVSEEIEDIKAQDFEFLEECERIWKWKVNDWINDEGGFLTGYMPSEDFTKFLNSEK